MEILIIFSIMLILMALKVPVAFSMATSATVALLLKGVPLMLVPQRMFTALDSFPLLAIPLFIFVGQAMNTGGITDKIFNFARVYVRHIKGSLGHVNVIASIIFAGMSGSAVADTSGLGLVEIKAMNEDGFDPEFSAAITAASSTIGPIIPPSIPLVIYAVIAEQSVGRLFLGGVIPGLLMGLALMVYVYVISKKRGYKVEPRATFKERINATIAAIPSLLTPVLLLSGIVFGIVTPTEGAAIAAIYALFLGFIIHKELTLKDLYKMLLSTASSTATILIIISSASIITWVILSSDMPAIVAKTIFSVTNNKYLILFIVNIILLILGCFMEGTSIIMIMVPVLLPIMKMLNVDLVHFGVFLVLNVMIGLITPPVGMCLYIVSKIAGISFERTSKAIIPFIIALIVVLFLITYVPEFVTFLPNLIMDK
ncbi:MAG TPA: TRAP transporter large permease [Thermoanaerobacterales bacterium]|nr:TRAP transporter large permease [Thermoanaerobacterales bacterium]